MNRKAFAHQFPKISFGIIILNGEPFTRYCIRALYPHAHEILIVEGSVEKARPFATANGHSTDSTRQTIDFLKANEDPENKIKVISQEGFWPDQNDMCQAYAEVATGDYLWQVDSDEFYLSEDIEKIRTWLAKNPTIDGASFRWRIFWGNEKYITDGWFLRQGGGDVNRLFRWGKGFQYDKHHQGPIVINSEGRIVNEGNWLSADALAREGIYLYHLSLVFPSQVLKKTQGYATGMVPNVDNSKAYDWAQKNWLLLENPFRTHNRYQFIAWLERYEGSLPQAVIDMFNDIRSGKVACELREMEDAIRIERSRYYRLKRSFLRFAGDFIHRHPNSKLAFLLLQISEKWVNEGIADVMKSSIGKIKNLVFRSQAQSSHSQNH
ncbi:hypothetical protein PCC7418_2775 [Halothece sp. PCC 7418]|uniref:glycosyltransferase family 2 protein n=1 Tax=Halothece sp. (strain PCC 7418) TaxID=65093 RepID=UPI0002A0840F|nr:glycosyltransferase family A protein [Halothece sp. PCC 7418]AFZ44911.1 hypothetical protein PCC7418_2775 [Halothece sp. PCC 7418]